MPMLTKTSSLLLELQGAVRGAEQRRALAVRSLRAFYTEHSVCIGTEICFRTAEPSSDALRRELSVLQIECDESQRGLEKALADLNAEKKACGLLITLQPANRSKQNV